MRFFLFAPTTLNFRYGCLPALSDQKVGIMEVDSEHMRMRLMPSPVQCLNAIKVRIDPGTASAINVGKERSISPTHLPATE